MFENKPSNSVPTMFDFIISKTPKKAINLKIAVEASEQIVMTTKSAYVNHRIPLAANSSLTLRR